MYMITVFYSTDRLSLKQAQNFPIKTPFVERTKGGDYEQIKL